MSVSQPESGAAVLPDFSSMTEEEQIAYAMQMSLAGGGVLYWTIHKSLLCLSLSRVLYIFKFILHCLQSMGKWTQEPPWTLQNLPR